MTPLFEKDFTVQYYETDQRGFARPVALLNYLQSAPFQHFSLTTNRIHHIVDSCLLHLL